MPSTLNLSMADDLEPNALRHSDREAFVFGTRRVTHAAFLARVQRLSSAWYRLGLRRQDRVSILAQNCMEFVEVYGAGEWAGFVTATVNFRLAPPEMLFIINDAAPRVLVFEAGYADAVERLRAQLKSVEHCVCIAEPGRDVPSWAVAYEAVMASGDTRGAPCRATADDAAYLIYTSGTTGRPKGCIEAHREVRAWALAMALAHGSAPDDRSLLMMPFFHVGAKFVQLTQHLLGGTVHVQRGFDVQAVLDCIARERITVTHMAPVMVQSLLESPQLKPDGLRSLRTILYGAAPMPEPILRKGLELLGPVFIQTYGQTETLGTSLARHEHRPDGSARERSWLRSVGRPYAETQLRIVDEHGSECAAGVAGEIVLRSAARFNGYWNNSAATSDTLRDGWVHTGDIGRVDDQGFLFLVDRKKDMIISGGENIYSREVEDALVQHPAVSECAVIGTPDARWGEAVCAVVVLRAGRGVTADELVEHSRTLIASYKKPKRVIFVDSIPKLPSGKVSKVELRRMYAQ